MEKVLMSNAYYTPADRQYKDLAEAVRQFFAMLDIVEESDSGNMFHPIFISNCRVMLHDPMKNIIKQMKEMSRDQ